MMDVLVGWRRMEEALERSPSSALVQSSQEILYQEWRRAEVMLVNVQIPTGFKIHFQNIHDDNYEDYEDREVSIMYMPPIRIDLLPETERFGLMPRYRIICPWLTYDQLRMCTKRLNELWQRKAHLMETAWAKWRPFLGNLHISQLIESNILDCNVVRETNYLCRFVKRLQHKGYGRHEIIVHIPSQPLHEFIIQYNSARCLEVFNSSNHLCISCCKEFQGIYCIVIKPCYHHYCKKCLRRFCWTSLKRESVLEMYCPYEEGCTSRLTETQVLAALGMSPPKPKAETVCCPRCFRFLKPHLGRAVYCPYCDADVCQFCGRWFHYYRPCRLRVEDKLRVMISYKTGDDTVKQCIRSKYGKERIALLFEEFNLSRRH